MNKAQKIIQPLINAAHDKYNKTSSGGLEYDHEDMAERALLTLEEASAALAALHDDITLVDVPTVSDELYDFLAPLERTPTRFTGDGTKARRYIEIKIYLTTLERKLFAELTGT